MSCKDVFKQVETFEGVPTNMQITKWEVEMSSSCNVCQAKFASLLEMRFGYDADKIMGEIKGMNKEGVAPCVKCKK